MFYSVFPKKFFAKTARNIIFTVYPSLFHSQIIRFCTLRCFVLYIRKMFVLSNLNFVFCETWTICSVTCISVQTSSSRAVEHGVWWMGTIWQWPSVSDTQFGIHKYVCKTNRRESKWKTLRQRKCIRTQVNNAKYGCDSRELHKWVLRGTYFDTDRDDEMFGTFIQTKIAPIHGFGHFLMLCNRRKFINIMEVTGIDRFESGKDTGLLWEAGLCPFQRVDRACRWQYKTVCLRSGVLTRARIWEVRTERRYTAVAPHWLGYVWQVGCKLEPSFKRRGWREDTVPLRHTGSAMF